MSVKTRAQAQRGVECGPKAPVSREDPGHTWGLLRTTPGVGCYRPGPLGPIPNHHLPSPVLTPPFHRLPQAARLGDCNDCISFLTFLCCFSNLSAQSVSCSFPFSSLFKRCLCMCFCWALNSMVLASAAGCAGLRRPVPAGTRARMLPGLLNFLERGVWGFAGAGFPWGSLGRGSVCFQLEPC